LSACRPASDLFHDPYFDEAYVSLYLREEEKLFRFEYCSGGEKFSTLSIKRPISRIGTVSIDEKYYDLESAYGYGGYLFTTENENFRAEALEAYRKHCEEEKIVAEFIRFHPFISYTSELRHFFDFFAEDRPTVVVDSTLEKEARWQLYSQKVRRKLRKCERTLTFSESDDLETFYNLYTETMRRNGASAFYFFPKSYFERLLNLPNTRLLAVSDHEEIVSMSFALFGKDIAHAHLSANHSEKMRLNGNYLLFDNLFDYAKEAGCQYTFIGGGRTNISEDSLLRFKRQFGSFELPFYIAGRIFDHERYTRYTSLWEEQNPQKSVKYFLKYRLEEPM